MNIVIEEVPKDKISYFVRFPYGFFVRDPYWTGELIKDAVHKLSPSHPFWQHSEAAMFMAKINGMMHAGRIAAIINRAHNSFHSDNCGFFGFFDCINDAKVANALLAAAEKWLRERGLDNIIGPVNPSLNETCGMLIDSYDIPPMIMMPYNPPYYPELMAKAGYAKVKDLFAFCIDPRRGLPEQYSRLLSRLLRNHKGLEIRKANTKNLDAEIMKLKAIYNCAWEKNWGFVPMTDSEFIALAKELKPVLRPEFLYFALYNGEPAGFVLILPNLNPALKAANGKLNIFNIFKFLSALRHIKSGRMLTLGIKKEYRKRGLELLLIKQAMDSAVQAGWEWGEMSWTLEDNKAINKTITSVGGVKYRTYRLYGKKL